MQYHYMTVELISWIPDLDRINLWMNHSVCSCELDQRINRKNQTQENDSFTNQTSLLFSPAVMNASIEWTPILSFSHKTIIKWHHKTWNIVQESYGLLLRYFYGAFCQFAWLCLYSITWKIVPSITFKKKKVLQIWSDNIHFWVNY